MKALYKILLFSLTPILFGCENSENKEVNNIEQNGDHRVVITKAQFQENNMALGSIEEKLFPLSIKVNGMIDVPPENKAIVSSLIGGYIKTIPLLVGDVVKKGQLLLTVENPEFVRLQQEYLEVKEQLDYLKSEYERQNTMFKEQIISQKVYLKAKSAYKTANATYNGLKKQLTLLNMSPQKIEQGNISSVINIYAPISGNITKVNVSKGSYVSPSTPILEIIDNDHIHLELSVFEKDIMRIKKGLPIVYSIPEASDKTFEAEVYLVGAALETNRTIKVHAHPKDESHNFLTGMFVNAEIVVDKSPSKALPETAFVEVNNHHYVLVLDEEDSDSYYFKQQKVDIGRTQMNYTEIADTTALNKKIKFLTQGAFGIIGN